MNPPKRDAPSIGGERCGLLRPARGAPRRFRMPAWLLLFGAAAAMPCAYAGGTPAGDRAAADAMEAAFEAIGTRRAADLARVYPPRTRLSVYIASDIKGFSIESVAVQIDGRVQAQHRYSALENRALQADGRHRVIRSNVAPGYRQIRVTVVGRSPGVAASDRASTAVVETSVRVTGHPRPLIIPVSQLTFADRGWWRFTPYAWHAGGTDPRVGMARFLRHVGQPYAAMFELFEMRAEHGPDPVASPAYRAEMAFGYLAFGMRDQARAQFDALRRDMPESDAIGDLGLGLARLYLRDGDGSAAMAVLAAEPPPRLPQRLLWLDLRSRALMAVGRDSAAAALLTGADQLAGQAGEAFADYPSILRFNRAVALIRAGARDAGRGILDELGRLAADGPAERAIRERANLALGFHLLDGGETDAAAAVLGRLPADSPQAGSAITGQGWAALAQTQTGRVTALGQGDRQRLSNAVAAWSPLAEYSFADDAVREAMVARAYAYQALGLGMTARHAYLQAIDGLQSERTRLTAAVAATRRDAATHGACEPIPPSQPQLDGRFFDESAFQSAERERRRLCVLSAFLRAPSLDVDDATCTAARAAPELSPDIRPWSACNARQAFRQLSGQLRGHARAAVAARAAAQQQRDRMIAMRVEALQAERRRVERYLSDARSGLAMNYE